MYDEVSWESFISGSGKSLQLSALGTYKASDAIHFFLIYFLLFTDFEVISARNNDP